MVCILAGTFLFASPDGNMYEKAPESVQRAVEKCDALIKDAKYASALSALSAADVEEDLGKDTDYLIYKRTEVLTTWFCFSMMHTMFDIKDFNSEEELYQFRHDISYGANDMSFNMRFGSNPEDDINEYVEQYGETPRINLARAQYYYDVAQRYGNQWLKSQGELLLLAFENYKLAVEGGFYDIPALSKFSESALFTRHFQESHDAYLELVEYVPDHGGYWYNLTSSTMYLGNYAEAVEYAKNAIKYPEENEGYQLDAYVILSDAYEYSGDVSNAIETLKDAVKKFPKQPYAPMTLGQLYYHNGKVKEALDAFYDCISCGFMNYESSSEIFDVVSFLFSVGDITNCYSILDRTEKLVEKNNTVLGMAYYIRAQVNVIENRTDDAKSNLSKAEKSFKKDNAEDALFEINAFKESVGL